MQKNKILFLAGMLILGMVGLVFAAEFPTNSKITMVTAYPDSALISRQADIKLTVGEHKVIFTDIISEIDEQSLRVSGQGSAEVKLFGAQVKREFQGEVPSEKIQKLQEQIQDLGDDIKRQQEIKRILSEEKAFLDSLRFFSDKQLPKELITKMPQPSDLDGMLKFMDEKLRDNLGQIMEAEFKIRDSVNKIDVLRRELLQINGGMRKEKRSVVVDLEVKKSGNLALNISYLVKGVSWQPIYDARADFVKSELELVSYGLLRQNTGEDWQDVEMTLSTAKPSIGGNLPDVSSWFLRPAERRYMGKMKANAESYYAEASFKSSSDMAQENAPVPAVIDYASAEERGTAVVYKLNHKTTVKADGLEQKLPIFSQVLKADFKYSSYPREVLLAYLGSRVKNAPELQLLSGQVSIFLDGDYVGSSTLANIGPTEEFDLYLGADENVKVKRDLVEKKVDDTLIAGIPSPTKHTTFKYKITVENYKSKDIKVKLFESMPVSEEKRIVVKMNQVSLEPAQKDWEDRKGVWLWELELRPAAKKEITYSFTVEHPRDMQVEGL